MVLLPVATIGPTTATATSESKSSAATAKSGTESAAAKSSAATAKSGTESAAATESKSSAATAKSSTESSARLVAQGSVASLVGRGCGEQPFGIRGAWRMVVPERPPRQPITENPVFGLWDVTSQGACLRV